MDGCQAQRRRRCSSIFSWKMNGHLIASLPHSLAKQTHLCTEGGRAKSPSVNCRQRLGEAGRFYFLATENQGKSRSSHPGASLDPAHTRFALEVLLNRGRLETGAETSSLAASSPLHCRGPDVLMGRAELGRMARLVVSRSSAALRPRPAWRHQTLRGVPGR